jgi:hypothetical protein
MFQTFDPYYQWLGIPPHLQPPHHYRLLGLELFESNPDVISVAADRQMAHVRMYQLGTYSDLSQKLLNEIASAKVCLLVPERKAAYDAELRKTLTSPPPSRTSGPRPVEIPRDDDLDLAPEKPVRNPLTPPVSPLTPPAKPGAPYRGSSSGIGTNKPAPSGIGTNRPSPSGIGTNRPSPSGIGTNRPSPSGIGMNRPASPIATPRPLPVRQPETPSAPPVPWSHEPPYMAEYRRRFFETLLKVGIFLFFLGILFVLFNALALPWIKSTFAPEDPAAKANSASGLKTNEQLLPPPPPPQKTQTPETTPAADEDWEDPEIDPKPSKASKRTYNDDFYIGCWHIYEDEQYHSSINLLRNHTAKESRHPSNVGKWKCINGDVRIVWKDGWHVVFHPKGDTVLKVSYSPDDPEETRPLNEGTAIKQENSPEESR